MSRVSTLRRVPVPNVEPPYDDELGTVARRNWPSAAPQSQGTLALTWVLPSGLPAMPEPPVLRLAPPLREDAETDFDPQPTPRALLPDPRRWGGQLVQAIVEVVAGDRPSTQLVRWTSPEVYTQIREATHRSWTDGARRAVAGDARTNRVLVRSVHLCEPLDGAAELCSTVHRAGRASAVALRLEGVDGRWLCTALQLG